MRTTAARKFPSLSTKHLTLRAPTLADAAAFRAVLSIPAVTRFSNWPDAPTKAQGERYLRWMSKALRLRQRVRLDHRASLLEDRRRRAPIQQVREEMERRRDRV